VNLNKKEDGVERKFCPFCGHYIRKDCKICPYCGNVRYAKDEETSSEMFIMRESGNNKSSYRKIKKISLDRTDIEDFITKEQINFFERVLSVAELLNFGKKEITNILIQNITKERDRDKRLEHILALRKYLSTIDTCKKLVDGMNYVFHLK